MKLLPEGQIRILRKPVNANSGLIVNRSKKKTLFLTGYVLCSLRSLKLSTEGQQYKEKTSPESYKTDII